MQLTVRAFPLREGQRDALASFAETLSGPRAEEASDFYRRFGVTHESWHLQETESGPWVIAVTHIEKMPPAEAAAGYAESSVEFDAWFRDSVRRLTGVDPVEQPLGPPTERIFAWSDPSD